MPVKRLPSLYLHYFIIRCYRLGIIIPVMPNLVRELLGDGSNGLSSVSAAATYGGWLIASYSITQFFALPLLAVSAIVLVVGPYC